jgi:hypothetical protein
MFTNLIAIYLGGLTVFSAVVVACAPEDSIWDIEFQTKTAVPLILFWPIVVPVAFLIIRLRQI